MTSDTMARRLGFLVSAIAVALLAGSTSAAAVGPEDVELVGFRGQLHDLGRECAGTFGVVDGVHQTRQYCHQQWLGADDARFTGTLTRVVNVDEYAGADFLPEGDVSLWVSTVTHVLRTDEGEWHSDATVSVTVDDARVAGEGAVSSQVVTFTGTGPYDGLTAVVWWQPGTINSPVRGVIFPGSPPLPPTDDYELLPR